MCSTTQSPRAVNAFSSACAARTCPAPEEAESSKTRGLVFMLGTTAYRRGTRPASRRLAIAGCKFFENSASHALDLSETRQIFLEFLIQYLRFLRTQLVT